MKKCAFGLLLLSGCVSVSRFHAELERRDAEAKYQQLRNEANTAVAQANAANVVMRERLQALHQIDDKGNLIPFTVVVSTK